MAGQGIGFWEWLVPGQLGPTSEGGGQGLYGIYTTDATSGLIAAEAAFLEKQGARASAPCNASAHAAPKAAADCSRTRVAGLPGTGSARRQSCLGQRVFWLDVGILSGRPGTRSGTCHPEPPPTAGAPASLGCLAPGARGGLAAVLHADPPCGTSTTRPNTPRSF